MDSADKLKSLIEAVGGMAEMAHIFYTSMIGNGADKDVAQAGMCAFIQAFWHEANEINRHKQQQDQDGE